MFVLGLLLDILSDTGWENEHLSVSLGVPWKGFSYVKNDDVSDDLKNESESISQNRNRIPNKSSPLLIHS
jgi:hypothetical protein